LHDQGEGWGVGPHASSIPPPLLTMNFELDEEHQQIRATLASFAEREIKPFSSHWDKTEHFPRNVIEKIGELGFLGVSFPERFGGGAADTLAQALVVEGLSRF